MDFQRAWTRGIVGAAFLKRAFIRDGRLGVGYKSKTEGFVAYGPR